MGANRGLGKVIVTAPSNRGTAPTSRITAVLESPGIVVFYIV